jgi:hypothetical protein
MVGVDKEINYADPLLDSIGEPLETTNMLKKKLKKLNNIKKLKKEKNSAISVSNDSLS